MGAWLIPKQSVTPYSQGCLHRSRERRILAQHMAIIFIFADGIGLAPAGLDNPLSTATMPILHNLLGGPLTTESVGSSTYLLLRPIDATLGVDGLPQSGTGHTALLGGFNASKLHGRHQPHLPPIALRPRLAAENVFHMVQKLGKQAAFANVFGPNYWQALEQGRLRPSASVIAANGAKIRLRTLSDYQSGAAVAWDVTGTLLSAYEPEIMPTTPEQAGIVLAKLAYTHDLVFFETFLPDLAAHERLGTYRRDQADSNDANSSSRLLQIHTALELIDALIGATVAAMRPSDTLLLTSDHGNIESLAAKSHTRHPVPLLAIGRSAPAFANIESIAGVADAIIAALTETP